MALRFRCISCLYSHRMKLLRMHWVICDLHIQYRQYTAANSYRQIFTFSSGLEFRSVFWRCILCVSVWEGRGEGCPLLISQVCSVIISALVRSPYSVWSAWVTVSPHQLIEVNEQAIVWECRFMSVGFQTFVNILFLQVLNQRHPLYLLSFCHM